MRRPRTRAVRLMAVTAATAAWTPKMFIASSGPNRAQAFRNAVGIGTKPVIPWAG